MKFSYSLLLISAIFCSCTANNEDKNLSLTKEISFNSFTKSERLTFSRTGLNFGYSVSAIEIIDSMLVWSNMRDSNLIHIYGLNSKKFLGSVIKRGNQNNECLNISDILPTSNATVFWAYDITLGKFVKIELDSFLKNKIGYNPRVYFFLNGAAKGAKSPVWVSDSLFSACSYFLEDCRYFKFTNKSKITEKIGVLPPPLANWPEKNPKGKLGLIAYSYKANLRKHPKKNVYAVPYMTSGRMEIYQNDILKNITKGPEKIDPIYDFRKNGRMLFPTDNTKTKQTNTSIKVTDKYIYVLYSGKDNFQYGGQMILVYDWEGRPVKMLMLPSPCVYFCVRETSDNSTNLILVERETRDVVSAKLKF